jgi:hypothetical protein
MKECRIYNPKISEGITMMIQVLLIFAFLTIFFFNYVVKVEKKQTEKQLRIIIDNILGDEMKKKLPILFEGKTEEVKDSLTVIINGTLDVIKEKSIASSRDVNKGILTSNNKLKTKAGKILIISCIGMAALSILLILSGFCLSLKKGFKESLIVVLFVAISEYLFLTFISSRYIFADPNALKQTVAKSVKKWIKENHPDN